MKRFLSIFLSLVMISSALSSSVFAAEAQGYGSDNSQILYVDDYMEFYENQDYYMDLVDNQHYVLVIDVPDEYLEMEKTRIAGGAEVNALTEGPTTRGTSVPTRAWNVNTNGTYSFSVSTAKTPIYTNYYFVGANAYRMSVLNTSNVVPAGAYVYGYSSGRKFVETYSSKTSTVVYSFPIANPNSHFYVCFLAPSYLMGSISVAN